MFSGLSVIGTVRIGGGKISLTDEGVTSTSDKLVVDETSALAGTVWIGKRIGVSRAMQAR